MTSQELGAGSPVPGDGVVSQVLATEIQAVQDTQHPMRYLLRKSSPRLTTTKEICETKDGAVARLVAIDDKSLSPADEQKEEARLNTLLSDPSRQRYRKQGQDADQRRAMKVLRALPAAFVYEFAGFGMGPTGRVEKFTFRPNPNYDPPDMETQVLSAMTGEIWIDTAQQRVARLEGHLQRDVDFGLGILGRLYKGGWIVIEQADVGQHQWRVVRFQMSMNGRVLFKNKSFDTEEEESHFQPVPLGLSYAQAIQLLRSSPQVSRLNSR
jgi:hypothetical protein